MYQDPGFTNATCEQCNLPYGMSDIGSTSGI